MKWRERLPAPLRRLARDDRVFVIANGIFWVGLAALLLSHPVRLLIGGSLLALALGGYLLYAAFSPKVTRGLAYPAVGRWFAGGLGVFSVCGGAGMLIGYALDGAWAADVSRRGSRFSVQVLESLIPLALLALAFGLVAVIYRWWARRDAAQLQAARQRGEVFLIPPAFRSSLLLVLLLLFPFEVLLPVAYIISGGKGSIGAGLGLGLPALFAPLVLLCLWGLWYLSGYVLLTPQAVILGRFGREKVLPYTEIVALHDVGGLRFELCFRGSTTTLRIPLFIENRLRLYREALARVDLSVPALPLRFGASRLVWWATFGGMVALILVLWGLGAYPAWATYRAEPRLSAVLPPAVFGLSIAAIFCAPLIVMTVQTMFKSSGPFGLLSPTAWEFFADRVRFCVQAGPWREYPRAALQRLSVRKYQFRARRFAPPVDMDLLVLCFSDGLELALEQTILVQSGLSAGRFLAIFEHGYPDIPISVEQA